MSASPRKRGRPRTATSTPRAATDGSPSKPAPSASLTARNAPLRTPSRSRHKASKADDDDEGHGSDEVASASEDSEDDMDLAFSGPLQDVGTDHHQLLSQTSFDAYILHMSKPARTSSNVFSSLVEPVTAEEYRDIISASSGRISRLDNTRLLDCHEADFPRYLRELRAGFNLLFYGFGSKRNIINRFATSLCAKLGHVVVVNAFSPQFSLKDMLASLEQIPGVLAELTSTTGPDGQVQRIYDFFLTRSKRPLFLFIHNIDAPALRAAKARAVLSLLGLHPRIHLVASLDHVNAPLLWSTSESSARKPSLASLIACADHSSAPRGYAWLWHDLTTLENYDFELAFADRTSIHGASHRASTSSAAHTAVAGVNAGPMTETAARHVLASVTQKAKKLFVIMGRKQLELIDSLSEGDAATVKANPNTNDLQRFAIGYDALFSLARDSFVATSDGALGALLGEFRDHGLVLSAPGAGAAAREVLWIPLRRERLVKLVGEMEREK